MSKRTSLDIVSAAKRSVSDSSSSSSVASDTTALTYTIDSIQGHEIVLRSKINVRRVAVQNLPLISKNVQYAQRNDVWGIRFIRPTDDTRIVVRLYQDTGCDPKLLSTFPFEEIVSLAKNVYDKKSNVLLRLMEANIYLVRHEDPSIVYAFKALMYVRDMAPNRVSVMELLSLVPENEPSEHLNAGIALLLNLKIVVLIENEYLMLRCVQTCLDEFNASIDYKKKDNWFPKWFGAPPRKVVLLDAPDVWHDFHEFECFQVVRRAHDVTFSKAESIIRKTTKPLLFIGRLSLAKHTKNSVFNLLQCSVVQLPNEIERAPEPRKVIEVASFADAERLFTKTDHAVYVGAAPNFRYASSRPGIHFSLATDYAHQDANRVKEKVPTWYSYVGHFNNGHVSAFTKFGAAVDYVVYVPIPVRDTKLDIERLSDLCRKAVIVVKP